MYATNITYRERCEWRRWYRTTSFGQRWPDLAEHNRCELRKLVQARWNARRGA